MNFQDRIKPILEILHFFLEIRMTILKYGARGEEVTLLQRALNELTGKNIKPDGDFGKITEEALRYYQTRLKLPVNGIYGQEEYKLIEPLIAKKYIRFKDIEKRANVARLPADILKAFRVVEAKGAGFLPNGKVIILFERHKFYQYLASMKGRAFADSVYRSNPSICNPARGGYLGNEKEYPRIERAIAIHKEAALMSASYGLFQIMGFNYKAAGYNDVHNYVKAMETSEANQLDAVINFIKKDRGLHQAILNRDFNEIARRYNGPAYEEHGYHTRLRDAAREFS